jgi:DNA-binding CsgD family transcriptional regulator
MQQLQRFMDVSQAPDIALFERRLIDFAHDMQFGVMAASLIVERPGLDPSITTLGNTPMGFLAAQSDVQDAKRDPVIRRMKRLSIPFAYDQSLYVAENAGDLWEHQAQFGYRTGISVALHLPGGKHFLLGFDREETLPDDEPRLTRLFADLQLLAVHAQDAALRLMTKDPALADLYTEPPALTPRELEVLKWAMAGKTSAEMGQVMRISRDTVNFHLKNAMAKLRCNSRSQAVLKAMQLRLI